MTKIATDVRSGRELNRDEPAGSMRRGVDGKAIKTMQLSLQSFGGSWTTDKLERVRRYLRAYTTIMSKQRFEFVYIDAFAGTGYRLQQQDEAQLSLGGELGQNGRQSLDGSARIALQLQPRFSKYIFIEKSARRVRELEKLVSEFPHLKSDVEIVNCEANSFLQGYCRKPGWRGRRAVLFLDPFGLQVEWETIRAIASTKAIDLWVLFPLGAGVNRLLTKDGKIVPSWRQRLDTLLGTPTWYDAFYRVRTTPGLFGDEILHEKVCSFDSISSFFVDRLRSVFAQVVENPRFLYNSRGIPLYSLCFAAGNPKGAPTAVKIAGHILSK